MKRALSVCMGNIFRIRLPKLITIFYTGNDYAKSAGLRPQDNVNNYIPETVKEAMFEVGIELSGNSKLLSKGLMKEADFIIAMDRRIPTEIPSEYAYKLILWDTRDTTPENRKEIREIRDFIMENV